jgi:serine phosphatase RsbU (regulator of sigma subunit)
MKIKTKLMVAAIALVMIPMSLAIFLPSFILEREKQIALRNRLFVGLSEARKIINAKSKDYASTVMALTGSPELRSNLYVLKKYGTRLDQSIRNGFRLAIEEHLSSVMSGSEAAFMAVYDADGALVAFVKAPLFDVDLKHLPLAHGAYFAFVQDDLLLIEQRSIVKDNQEIGSVSLGMAVDLSFVLYLSEIIDLQITFHLKKGICLGVFCEENLISSENALAADFPHIIGQKQIDEGTFLLARDRYDFGYLIAGLSVGDLIKKKNHVTRILVTIALLSTLIAIAIAFIWTKRSVVGPIHELIKGTRRVGRGELDTTFDIQTKDEIKELGDAFNEMTASLTKHIKQLADVTATKERIESELKIAHDIQMGILQKIFPPFPDRHEFDIYAAVEPARDIGGDFYDFFFMGDDHLCFAVGDVSDKGVPAALFMAVTKTLIKNKATKGLAPEIVLTRVNQDLCLDNPSLMFVTLFLGILNVHNGELVYCNGGHNPPYIIRASGDIEPVKPTGGMALGVAEDFVYQSRKIALKKGDAIFLYTDGVTEAMNGNEELFSEERLENELAGLRDEPVHEVVSGVMEKIKAFSQDLPQTDDITMMILRFDGSTIT